jgi:prophage maintenance system killer protein
LKGRRDYPDVIESRRGRDNPFNDGQKRTGFQVADNILRTSGLRISAPKEVICKVLCEIAEYNCTLVRIEDWLRKNTEEI